MALYEWLARARHEADERDVEWVAEADELGTDDEREATLRPGSARTVGVAAAFLLVLAVEMLVLRWVLSAELWSETSATRLFDKDPRNLLLALPLVLAIGTTAVGFLVWLVHTARFWRRQRS